MAAERQGNNGGEKDYDSGNHVQLGKKFSDGCTMPYIPSGRLFARAL